MSVKPIRNLLEYLKIVHLGRFDERCEAHLAKAIEEVENSVDEKAAATITLTIHVQKIGERYDITANVNSKLPPERPFKADTAWVIDGAISLQHPRQFDMFNKPRPVGERDTG